MNDIYTTRINESIASLFANMEKRISAEDMQRVRDAYALAAEAHKEQRRQQECCDIRTKNTNRNAHRGNQHHAPERARGGHLRQLDQHVKR